MHWNVTTRRAGFNRSFREESKDTSSHTASEDLPIKSGQTTRQEARGSTGATLSNPLIGPKPINPICATTGKGGTVRHQSLFIQ